MKQNYVDLEYKKYPAQMLEVAGDLRWAPAKFENPAGPLNRMCLFLVLSFDTVQLQIFYTMSHHVGSCSYVKAVAGKISDNDW